MHGHGADHGTWSRRQVLAGAGALASGLVAGACGLSGSARRAPRPPFRSRPDLHPAAIRVDSNGPTIAGFAFVTPAGPKIVDGRGEPVWIHSVRHATTNLRVQHYRDEPVLTWWEGRVNQWGTGEGVGRIVGSDYRTIATVRCGHGLSADLHEFVLTERGTAYLTAVKPVAADLRPVGGPKHGRVSRGFVQEVDVATGDVVFEWDSSQHIPLSETKSRWRHGEDPSKPLSAVHLNSVNVMNDGNLLISARDTWTLYKVDATTGAILWRLGGDSSDFTVEPDARFAWQHDAQQHRDGTISVFDNEASPAERSESRALFLDVQETAMHVRLKRQYTHPRPPLLAASQGSVQVLPNGDVFVGWGSQPYYTRFAPGGAVLLDAQFEGVSYRAFHFDWTGTPAEPPAVVAERHGPTTTVYASWNGATEVRRWRVLGGATPAALEAVAAAPRRGFETVITVRGAPGWVSAEALDASGAVLGTAAPTRPRGPSAA